MSHWNGYWALCLRRLFQFVLIKRMKETSSFLIDKNNYHLKIFSTEEEDEFNVPAEEVEENIS